MADAAAAGHLLIDLERHTLDRALPLALLPPDAAPLVPDPLPDTLLPEPAREVTSVSLEANAQTFGPTIDASSLPEQLREQFHRNLRTVEQVLAGAAQTHVAKESGISRSTLSRLVQRTRQIGQIACVPHGSYRRKSTMHPAFQECIRRLYLLPVCLSMTAIHEHTEMRKLAAQLEAQTGKPVKTPSYDQVRREIRRLKREPELVAVREGTKAIPRARESAESFALSIPSPALLAQVDEHSLELYVVTPDGIPVASRVHAAVLVCVKTAAILGAVLSLGPLKEEDYMRLVKMALEPKDQQVVRTGCQHAWPCFGKPAIIFHDRGKIFDQPDTMWLQFRRRLDKLEPFCRVEGHTSEEVREILATLERVYREPLPHLNLRQWSGSIYTWLTQPVLDPTNSGRVTMDYLMKLVTTALEWTYQAGETDVRAETLESAASLLVLRRDTLRIIDGAGPSIEVHPAEREQGSMPLAETDEAPALDPLKQRPHLDEVGGTQTEMPSAKCSFSGPIELEAARWLQSAVQEVQCPTCGSVSKAKVKGQSVVIAPHPPRKLRAVRNVTRWMEQGTAWVLVQKKE